MSHVLPLLRRSLADTWRGLIGWTAGVAGILLVYLPIYPSFGANGQMEELIASLPPELVNTLGYDQIATGAGYAQATFYGLVGFVLVTIAAIGWGTGAIANDEENGQLELTLAHGVVRGQVLGERAAAVLLKLVWLALAAALVVAALNDSAELSIETGPLIVTSVALVGLAFLSASAAIGVGAITGRRGWALGAGAGVAVYSYAVNALGNQSEDLAWLHDWSPYSWAYAEDPLTNGWDWRIWLLYAASAVLLFVGWLVFRRRDVAI